LFEIVDFLGLNLMQEFQLLIQWNNFIFLDQV
jgi:hypothetical protein